MAATIRTSEVVSVLEVPKWKWSLTNISSLFLAALDDQNSEDDQEVIDDPYSLFRYNYLRILNPEEGFRRLTRGAHHECCDRPCNFETLRSYCLAD